MQKSMSIEFENLEAIGSQRITIAMQSNKVSWDPSINLCRNQPSKQKIQGVHENWPEVQARTGNELSSELIEIFRIERNNPQPILLHWNLILRRHNSFPWLKIDKSYLWLINHQRVSYWVHHKRMICIILLEINNFSNLKTHDFIRSLANGGKGRDTNWILNRITRSILDRLNPPKNNFRLTLTPHRIIVLLYFSTLKLEFFYGSISKWTRSNSISLEKGPSSFRDWPVLFRNKKISMSSFKSFENSMLENLMMRWEFF